MVVAFILNNRYYFKKKNDLICSVAPMVSVAPIAPLNSAPIPTAAFTMAQPVQMAQAFPQTQMISTQPMSVAQPLPSGIVPPLVTSASTIPPIVPVATGNFHKNSIVENILN